MIKIDGKLLRFVAVMNSAVILKIGMIFGGYMGGGYLDKLFGTHPWFMLLGLTVGSGLGLFWVVYNIQKYRP